LVQRAAGLVPLDYPQHFTGLVEVQGDRTGLSIFPRSVAGALSGEASEILRGRAGEWARLGNGNFCTCRDVNDVPLDHQEILEVTVGFQGFLGGQS
jgi:hypothetical protein